MAVAHRTYATALFEAAKDAGKLELVRRELREFTDALGKVPELRALLGNPQFDTRMKLSVLDDILKGGAEIVRNFVHLVVEKGRGPEIAEMGLEFERKVRDEEGILDVELTTAVELSDAEAARIVQQIKRASGSKVEATRTVDPDLIGGVVLQVGSLRLDGSVRGRLEGLRRQLSTARS